MEKRVKQLTLCCSMMWKIFSNVQCLEHVYLSSMYLSSIYYLIMCVSIYLSIYPLDDLSSCTYLTVCTMTSCSVTVLPMTTLVSEASRLLLVCQSGDQRLDGPVGGSGVGRTFPFWDTVVKVENAHLCFHRRKIGDVGRLVECPPTYVSILLNNCDTPFNDDPSHLMTQLA